MKIQQLTIFQSYDLAQEIKSLGGVIINTGGMIHVLNVPKDHAADVEKKVRLFAHELADHADLDLWAADDGIRNYARKIRTFAKNLKKTKHANAMLEWADQVEAIA